jgi:hypothetical protein
MNAVCSTTAAIARSISGLIESYCAFRSTNGIGVTVSMVCIFEISRVCSAWE